MPQTPPFAETTSKPWGEELVFTEPNLSRVGKILFIQAGKRFSLQYHDLKEETILLFQGEALIYLGDSKETVQPIPMQSRVGYTILPGMLHRIEAVTDSYFFEVSSPEVGVTYRIEDDYSRPNEELLPDP